MSNLTVTVSDIKKDLEKKQSQFAKAINATTSDFGRRGQGWVSQEVRKVYNTDLKTIKSTYKGYKKEGKIRVGGVQIDNVKLLYQGRTLTLSHFGMTPKARPSKPYQVKAAVLKGAKKVVASDAFVGSPKGVTLAFRREGSERLPIKALRALSVPQMVTSDRTEPSISKRISEELEKRWEHNVERFNK